MADCPKCEAELRNPKECRECGWKARARKVVDDDQPKREYVHCAFEQCPVGAIARGKTPKGWANFCEEHYTAFHTHQAAKSMRERGLERREDETPQAYRKRLMAWMRGNAKLKTFGEAEAA